MTPELKEQQLAFFEKCDSFKGRQIHIRAALSTNGENFDRHFTTFTTMVFELKHFGVRTSGARAMFMGEHQTFEIAIGLIEKIEVLKNDTFEVLEKYSEKIFRRTVIRFEEKRNQKIK
ncbi:MAG: hypothetical protein ACPG49_10360 [Chitinophagales bacterium]